VGDVIGKRKDIKMLECGEFGAAWGLQPPQIHPYIRQGLLLLYALKDCPTTKKTKHFDSATHEFMLYRVDPRTPIDFARNLWEQPHVSPLLPARLGFQITAASDEDAVCMLDRIAEKFIRLELTPLLADEWVDMIPNGKMIVFPEFEPHAFYDKLSEGVLPKLPPDAARRLGRNAFRKH
jgi:hypothetical protein